MKRFLLVLGMGLAGGMQEDTLIVPGYDCGHCHGAEGWTVISFSNFEHDHTAFPLLGAHTIQLCNACHKGKTVEERHQFQLASVACNSCHMDIHESVLGENCTQCHESESWTVTPRTFDHETTMFSLSGAHRFTACSDCHKQLPVVRFDFTPTDCYGCHSEQYEKTNSPNHLSANFGIDCEQCHSVRQETWDTSFDHSLTEFPLLGLHKPLQCEDCHQGNNYQLSFLCSSCHLEDYQTTLSPNHVDYGYPLEECRACHTEFGWIPHRYIHDLPHTCNSCHIPDFNLAVDPPHSNELGFTLDCEQCHVSTTTWKGAVYMHENIVGHCVACHQEDYNNTSNPDHGVAGLDTNCESCHISTSQWTEVNFPHEFPINPHPHQDEKIESCNSCHGAGFAPPSFSCTLSPCHQGMDSEHFDDGSWESCTINGVHYTYDSNATDDPQCITCHPNGDKDSCGDGDKVEQQNWRNSLELIPR